VINFVFVTGRRSLSLLLTITEITRPVRMYYGSGTADGVASEQQSIYCMQEHMQRPPRGRCVWTHQLEAVLHKMPSWPPSWKCAVISEI